MNFEAWPKLVEFFQFRTNANFSGFGVSGEPFLQKSLIPAITNVALFANFFVFLVFWFLIADFSVLSTFPT